MLKPPVLATFVPVVTIKNFYIYVSTHLSKVIHGHFVLTKNHIQVTETDTVTSIIVLSDVRISPVKIKVTNF